MSKPTENKKEKIRPKVGVGVYILNEKKEVLLIRRKGSHGEGDWCPPGGHLEMGESFLECAQKEAKEEADIDVHDVTLAGITNDIYSTDKHYVTLSFLCTSWSGEPEIMEPEKAVDIGWFALDNLPSPIFLSTENFFRDNPKWMDAKN